MKSIYPLWRRRLIHVFAKALGVLVHIEGFPFGSNRIYLRSRVGNAAKRDDLSARTLPVYDPITGTARFLAEGSASSKDSSQGEPENPEAARQ